MSKTSNFNKHLNFLKMNIISNVNISSEHLNGSALYLNKDGKSKLAINLIKKVQKLRKIFLIKINSKVYSPWLSLSTMLLIPYVIMIVKNVGYNSS